MNYKHLTIEERCCLREYYKQGYQAMLADAKQHRFEVLLIHKYDRVARSLEEHVRLSKMMEKEKIPIIAVAQNFGASIEGDFAKQMMWVLSEYYSKNLAKEVRKGHREVALKGLHNGGPAPFG
ncbi:MAG: recombinase family protein, partial [Clostridia bacterium]|nr:recombinase family protein [Clostridia bacterium]